MKAFFLSLALLVSTTAAFGQVSVKASLVLDKPFKGANTIIVALPDSGVVAWEKAIANLTAQGFTIASSNQGRHTLTTQPKRTAQSGDLAVSAVVKGNSLLLKATTSPSDGSSTVEYRGKKNSPALLAWQQLETVAQSLGGAREYTRQQ